MGLEGRLDRMLEVGKFYKNNVMGNSYKCLKIENSKATLWLHIDFPPEAYFPIQHKDGTTHIAKTMSAEIVQDLEYQGQYRPVTDEAEVGRLSRIYDENNQKPTPMIPIKPIVGLTLEKFEAIMNEIDNELIAEDPRIPGRELRAIDKIAEKLNIDNFPLHPEIPVSKDGYDTNNITTHVVEWLRRKYGNKLNMQNNLAHMILDIKGAYFRVGFPTLYGTMDIVCDPSLKTYKSTGQGNNPAIFNLLAYIEDLTPKLASELTETELTTMARHYGATFNAVLRYDNSGLLFQQDALADIETAVNFCIYDRQQYGQSKWASLQFTEKLMKGILDYFGEKFAKTHNLEKLADQINKSTKLDINMELIKKISCQADVRYSADTVSLIEAVAAHHASLAILACVMEHFSDGVSGG